MNKIHPSSRFGKLLVATDFSRGAADAVARAVRLPLAPGATMHLLHVLPASMPSRLAARAERNALSQIQQTAAIASRVAKAAGNAALNIHTEVVAGPAHVEIIRRARAEDAELVVVGRHGKRGLRELLVGSTAIRVIRIGDIPVLVVNQEPAHPYLRPLIGVSLEDVSREILRLALKVLTPAAKTISVVHAYEPPFEGAVLPVLTAVELTDYHQDFKRQAESRLTQLLESVRKAGLRAKPVARRGDPRAVVLREAMRRHADLIAIGTHARSGLSHVLLGSVAEWLIRNARCDVLVARPHRFSFRLP